MMSLHISDLRLGDIVLSLPSSKSEGWLVNHAAMVTRLDPEKDQCWVTHAVQEKYKSIFQTLLTRDEYTTFRIWRCQNASLAALAAELMSRWSMLSIPYGYTKAEMLQEIEGQLKIESEPESGVPRFLEYAKESYRENFFRILKYAARRETRLSEHKGFTSAEIVVMAFQVAGVSSFFLDQDQAGITWTTDKYSTDENDRFIKQTSFFKQFCRYRDNLRTGSEFRFFPRDKNYHPRNVRRFPSAIIWNEERDGSPEAWFLSSDREFGLDAKITTPSLLMFYMQENKRHWDQVGVFFPSQAAKTSGDGIHQNFQELLSKVVSLRHDQELNRRFSSTEPFYIDTDEEKAEVEEENSGLLSPSLTRARSQSSC